MRMNWRFILKNIVPIFSALGAIGGVVIAHTYFKPNLRYEEGAFYRSGERAITSLKLQNYGMEDAEEIRISVSFPETILDLSTSNDAIRLDVKNGGIGTRSATGIIQRLVPSESVYLYIAIKNPDGPIPEGYDKFIPANGIIYKGGIAKHGPPFSLQSLLLGVLAGLVFSLLLWAVITRIRRRYERLLDDLIRTTKEAQQIARNAIALIKESQPAPPNGGSSAHDTGQAK